MVFSSISAKSLIVTAECGEEDIREESADRCSTSPYTSELHTEHLEYLYLPEG